jgi:hypothetical protein
LLISAYGNSRPSVSEEELQEKHANIKGGNHLVSASSHQSTGVNTETDSAIMEDDSVSTKKGMILPFDPLSLTFDNIKYSVDMPQVKYRKLISYTTNTISSLICNPGHEIKFRK